jgi:hypothetical protein
MNPGQAYLKACEQEWASLPAGDTRIPLTDVYIMLQAVETRPPTPLEPRPDLPPLPEREEHAGLPERKERPHPSPPSPPVPLSKALAAARHLTILGEPGAGKSTTLQFIGLCFTQEGRSKEKLGMGEPCIPVLVELRKHAAIMHPQARLIDDIVIPIVHGWLPSEDVRK